MLLILNSYHKKTHMVNPNAITIANKAARAAKARYKAAWKHTLDDVLECIHTARTYTNGALPHIFVLNLVATMGSQCPWINRDIIDYHYNMWSRRTYAVHNERAVVNTLVSIVNAVSIII